VSTITFDTLELVEKLKAGGVPQLQAESIVRVIAEAQDRLVTREYLDSKFQQELAPLKTDLAVLKWMMGIVVAGVVSLVLKAFF
jgi:hypothetical protein